MSCYDPGPSDRSQELVESLLQKLKEWLIPRVHELVALASSKDRNTFYEEISYLHRSLREITKCKAEQNPAWYSGVDQTLHFLNNETMDLHNEVSQLQRDKQKLTQELEGMWAHIQALEQKLANKEVNEKLDCLTLNTTWAWGGPLPASCTIRGFQDDQNS